MRIISPLFFLFTTSKAIPSSFIKSSFIPPASPTIASNNDKNTPSKILISRLVTGYGLAPPRSSSSQPTTATTTQLYAAKKKAKKGIVSKGGKVQVKLLKKIEGTGNVGDVVMVAPAFFENALKKTKSAVLITDDEVNELKTKREKSQQEKNESAKDMQDHLEGYQLVLQKKAGPEGHLFGGISKKVILEELKKKFPKGALDGKQVKVLAVKDGEGVELDHDIKDLGDFTATIGLLKNVNADVSVSVIPEG